MKGIPILLQKSPYTGDPIIHDVSVRFLSLVFSVFHLIPERQSLDRVHSGTQFAASPSPFHPRGRSMLWFSSPDSLRGVFATSDTSRPPRSSSGQRHAISFTSPSPNPKLV